MSDLIERAKVFIQKCNKVIYGITRHADYARCSVDEIVDFAAKEIQSERTRIADEIEALSQKTPIDAMVTALLEYADKLRKND